MAETPTNSDYMLVMISAMSEIDQRMYASYPEAFGQCAFSGQIGTCKVVPTDGPTKKDSEEEAEFKVQMQEALAALKTMNAIPAATTAMQLLRSVIGRPTATELTDPTTYENGETAHPTTEDIEATPEDLVATLTAAMPVVAQPGGGPND